MEDFKATLKLSKADKEQIDNLMRFIAKADMNLKGTEVIAAGNTIRWLAGIQMFYESEFKKSLVPKPTEIKQTDQPLNISKPGKTVKSKPAKTKITA